ncbi:DUF6325 family protein [Brachybacterium saurashtrense]|uniref:DUF1269 domain-containing protein n=1 Tax=Brachybacterium saurashtrense TaxID=556288 RepID=A0A345YLX5_9MICO|nr:DUF6325 family protein [Brachybacterium saurashtrense]AXK44927.1 DUF1269 domain-containing protein [Brachybacterium saurashtrense]RRR21611.1 DUF1269 domain-containing protein [Brachybacterium saurashtrense]
MTETAAGAEDVELGPVDFLIIEFPGGQVAGEGLSHLLDLVDRGVIRILDLLFVTKGAHGAVEVVEARDLDGDGVLDLTVFDGASSGLLDDEDISQAASALAEGSTAGVLIYENVWAAPLASALRRGGAQMIASGRIPLDDLMAAVSV